ncbi:hypothetical protein EDEG_00575 [Edhazardia aedis USNM 41457]|uniref:Uncharacterized protein n=1 Tax=Edhazardia aedis (strain USNM 41457) TaxID=1003232 RepID=J9DVR8_EDHAE|nr:hypothetical protein EDEG_00575 [Edhazardia aedis USNM 41457]|eukprot:EJW05377.1 hypothetical protein EDEG_00575 [Edhazardia aedis USNM 41457]
MKIFFVLSFVVCSRDETVLSKFAKMHEELLSFRMEYYSNNDMERLKLLDAGVSLVNSFLCFKPKYDVTNLLTKINASIKEYYFLEDFFIYIFLKSGDCGATLYDIYIRSIYIHKLIYLSILSTLPYHSFQEMNDLRNNSQFMTAYKDLHAGIFKLAECITSTCPNLGLGLIYRLINFCNAELYILEEAFASKTRDLYMLIIKYCNTHLNYQRLWMLSVSNIITEQKRNFLLNTVNPNNSLHSIFSRCNYY